VILYVKTHEIDRGGRNNAEVTVMTFV